MNNRTVFIGTQMKWLAVVTGVLCLTMATGALAEGKDRPCAEDAAKLCNDVQPGDRHIAQCLKKHTNELSPACKENIGKMKERMKEKIHDAREACKDDKEKLCKDIKPGEGRVMQCLKQHEGELSAACKKTIAHPRGRK